MNTVLFLILFPVVVTLLLLIIPNLMIWTTVVVLSISILTVASIYLVVQYFNTGTVFFSLDNHYLDLSIFSIEVILAVMIIGISLKNRQYLAGLLMLAGAAITIPLRSEHSVHSSSSATAKKNCNQECVQGVKNEPARRTIQCQ